MIAKKSLHEKNNRYKNAYKNITNSLICKHVKILATLI